MTVEELKRELDGFRGDAEVIFTVSEFVQGWPDWIDARVRRERDPDEKEETRSRLLLR